MLKRHPLIVGSFAACVVVGALLGFLYLSPEWSVLRRVAAGGVAGAGIVVLIAGPKLFVS